MTHHTVVHGDYRLDNLMFSPDGAVVALDWQTATVGSPTRDLAYFLETSLDVELRRRHEQALLAVYADALVAGGVDRGEAAASLQRYAVRPAAGTAHHRARRGVRHRGPFRRRRRHVPGDGEPLLCSAA